MSFFERATLERRRKFLIGAWVPLSFVGFLLGPVNGFFLLPLFLAFVWALGYELSRPVVADLDADALRARLVYSLFFAFVPLTVGLAVVTATGLFELVDLNLPLEVLLLFLIYGSSASGVILASRAILARRETRMERRVAATLGWAVLAGAAWFLAFLAMHLAFHTQFSSIHYLRVGFAGLVPACFVLVVMAAWALLRTWSPNRPIVEPERVAVEPTYRPYRGG